MRNHKEKILGTIVVLGASIMWAVEPILAKLSYQNTDFMNTFASRTLFAFIIIAAYCLIFKTKFIIVKKQYLPKLIYLSIAATLFADFVYIYALTKVPVINAVLIGHMQPVFIIIFGYFVLKQDKLTNNDYLGIVFMILAGIMVTTRTFSNLLVLRFGTLGDLYVLAATVAWATTAIVARKHLKSLDAGVIAFYRFLFAGIIFIGYTVFFRGIGFYNIYQILLGLVIGAGTILYYEGITKHFLLKDNSVTGVGNAVSVQFRVSEFYQKFTEILPNLCKSVPKLNRFQNSLQKF